MPVYPALFRRCRLPHHGVLWGCAPPPTTSKGWQIPDYLKGYVTQWGKDPIWSAAAPLNQAVPLPARN
jgi:hypothetical protein